MVDVMAASIKDYEYSGSANDEGDDAHNEGMKGCDVGGDVEVEMEDGELPEEGEICEEDDPEGRHQILLTDGSDVRNQISGSTMDVAVTRKVRELDREEVVNTRSGENSIMNSWMSGVKQRTKPTNTGSPTIDANEEYYGYGNASPTDVAGDKDYRNRSGDSADKDYRWMRDEDNHRPSGDAVNEFGDSDYRGGSPKTERRRRRSPSPTFGGSKRVRHSPPVRGGFRGRGFRGRWGERQICKFFREGYCRDGDNCSYSHDAADSGRKAELCKFYQQGFCKKGLQCPLLHGEYPCKAFHKGECSKDPCQFSHLPLNSFTQPIFNQMMKDDEFASRIAIPQGPLKRRVLLPGGPSSSPGSQSTMPVMVTVTAADSGGILPPPSVVVPTLASCAPPVALSQPQLVMPPPPLSAIGASAHSAYPAFFPHHSTSTPALIEPSPINITVPPPSTESTLAAQQYAANLDKRSTQDDDDDGSFNINKILEQITSKVKKDDSAIEESPASPPMAEESAGTEVTPTTIPENNVPIWKVIEIEFPPMESCVDPDILQLSLTSSTLRSDPRVKKALATQFDEFTNSLMNAPPPPMSHPSQLFTPDTHIPYAANPSNTAKDETSTPKMIDPRIVTNRDPRRRAIIADPRGHTNDPRLLTTSRGYEQSNGGIQSAQAPSTSSGRTSTDHQHSSAISMNRDHDHRTQSSGYQDTITADERVANDRMSIRISGGGVGWMPHIHSSNDPRQARKHGMSLYRNDYGSHDRDEREINHNRVEADTKPSTQSTSVTQPLSLREKRKNNEYESPLSRVPGSTRWNQ